MKFSVIYITLTGFLFAWELIVYLTKVSPLVIIRPSEIYPVLFSDFDVFQKELIFTMKEVLGGWLVGNLAGIIFATLIYRFKILQNLCTTVAVFVNAIPLIALSAILGGFIGTNIDEKILIVAILCFFPMFLTTLDAYTKADIEFQALMQAFNVSYIQKFIKFKFPYALPFIFTTLRINVVLAISTAVVSEFFGAHGGIGQFILARKGFYDLPMVWGAIFYLVLAGSLFYFVVEIIRKIVVSR